MTAGTEESQVQIVGYGSILIPISGPKSRPGLAIIDAMPRVQALLNTSPLSRETQIDRICVFITVNGELTLRMIDHGVSRTRGVGRCFNITLIVPAWCFVELVDPEFLQLIEGALLVAACVSAQKFGYSESIFRDGLKTLIQTERLVDLFRHELVPSIA